MLECLQSADTMTLEQICAATALPKSTAFRILSTLEGRGYIERGADDRRYRLSLKLLALTQNLMERNPLRRLALPYMRNLSNRFGETINLAVLSGKDVLYVDIIDSHHPFRVTESPGSRSPVYVTALGKALAAYLPPADQDWVISQQPFTRLTPTTIVSADDFRQALAEVRQQGYAIDEGEAEAGIRCVAVPILDPGGYPVAAISLSAPAARFSREMAQEAAAVIQAACLEVSRQLGYRPSA